MVYEETLSTIKNGESAAKIKLKINRLCEKIRKGERMNELIPFIEFVPEEFRYVILTDGTVLTDYIISNYGRVYSLKTNKYLQFGLNENGYCRVSFRINGVNSTKRLHRIVKMTFDPILNPSDYQVNHLDGNKQNNCIWNLKWETAKDNVIHAVTNGLKKIGEEHHESILSNEQVHTICKLLVNNYSTEEIYDELNLDIEYINFRKIVYHIRYGECWNHISKYYNFSREKQRYTKYNNDDIHLICKCLQEGKSYNEICDIFNLKDIYDRNLFKRTIREIADRKSYTEISSSYNFQKPKGLRDHLFSEEQIHTICKCILKGYDSLQILIELGINIDSIDKNKRTNMLRSINSIKRKKSFTQISNQYF